MDGQDWIRTKDDNLIYSRGAPEDFLYLCTYAYACV
jgi:hypothetical protein